MLKTFDQQELKSFGDFLSSPFFNKQTALSKLFKAVSKFKPDFNNEELEKRKIYIQIYPDKAYNDKIMRNLMTEMVKLGENFLELKYYYSQKGDRYNYLLNGLLSKRLNANFEKNAKAADTFFESSNISEENYYNILNLNVLKYQYGISKDPKMETTLDLRPILDPLLTYFSMIYFKLNYNLANRRHDYNFEHMFSADEKFINNFLDFVKNKSLKSEPVILIYYDILMLFFKSNDECYFNELRDLVRKYNILFNKREKRNFYLGMVSYCNRKLALKDRRYVDISFEIYNEMLDTKSYCSDESDVMLPVIFKNIVKCGIMTRKFDWTIEFIEKFKDKLTTGYDFNIYNFSYSQLYFKMKDFKKSMDFLAKVKYENVFDKLDVKSLLVQLYYDENSYESLMTHLDTYRHFLKHDKLLSKSAKSVYVNFIGFVTRLLKLKEDKNVMHEIESLRKEINDTIVYDSGWLIEKLDQIIYESSEKRI